MCLPPFGVTKLADICVACFQSGFFNHEYPPAQPLRENPAHLSKLKWLLWICIHQRRESNERSKQQPSNKLSAKRPSSGHGDHQPTVSRCCTVGWGGGQCTVGWAGGQCTVLHSPDTAPNDYRSRAAECRRGSARGNDLSVNYVTNISCVTTSHQWTLDILHISCLNPSHSL